MSRSVLNELHAIVRSPGFVRSRQLCRFLEHLTEKTLAGDTARLKESVLGFEVFGRTAGYDSRADPIVRTEARRLRQKLEEYYRNCPPQAGGVTITLPKGGYVPLFERIAERRVPPRSRFAAFVRMLTGAALSLIG